VWIESFSPTVRGYRLEKMKKDEAGLRKRKENLQKAKKSPTYLWGGV